MSRQAHEKLLRRINQLESFDEKTNDTTSWLDGKVFIDFLLSNDLSSQFILMVFSKQQYVHSLIVKNKKLRHLDHEDLLRWSLNPYDGLAGYTFSGFGKKTSVRFYKGVWTSGTQTLKNSSQLVYGRTFDGFLSTHKSYFEMNQEFIHASDLHWLSERHAYCSLDELGDVAEIINLTTKNSADQKTDLITSEPGVLENYLIATDSSLVRFFEYQAFIDQRSFSDPTVVEASLVTVSPQLFYEKRFTDEGTLIRGVQVVKPITQRKVILDRMQGDLSNNGNKYVEFLADDLFHHDIKMISTDPTATSNYFNMKDNDKPHELSAACFRPEVLLRYKSDPEKYTISDRQINCRNVWALRGFDFNAAGQVHAYICDLASIPYQEQLYWKSFNEEPKAGISERAIRNDFLAQWFVSPRAFNELDSTLHRWEASKVKWWSRTKSPGQGKFEVPLTDNSTEWANHFLELAKLVIEGFNNKYIKDLLTQNVIQFTEKEANQSLTLLEKLLNKGIVAEQSQKLKGLREVQLLRTKLSAHNSGSEALELTKKALEVHGSFEGHFQHVCKTVNEDLLLIEASINS